MRLRSILASLLIGPSLLACSALAADTTTSESNHTAGEPTFAQHPWLWADESEDEFKKNARDQIASDPWGDPAAPEFLALDHPMSQRLQFWVDKLDEALRAAHPEALKGTPRPRLIVKKTQDVNAWVSSIPIAWNVKTRHAGAGGGVGDGGSEGGADGDGSVREGGAIENAEAGAAMPVAPPTTSPMILLSTGRIWQSAQTPFARPHEPAQLTELLKLHNDGFSKCRLTKEGDVVVFGAACKRYPEVVGDRSDALTYYGTSKFITITTAYLLTLLDEDRIVSTLAHELGHYYRSHVNMPSDVLNYFYVLEENTHTHKPAPDPRSLEQTVAVRAKLNGDDPLDFTEENQLIAEKGLGFYTTEQEADEIAIELLAKIGVPGGVLIDKLLVLQKTFDQWPVPGEVKWAECSVLRERGFKDEAGKSVNVPIGDLSDPHHSNCFRAQNAAREIAAHKYTLGTRPTPPGEGWSRLVTRLGVEVDPLPPVPVAPPAPSAPGPSTSAPPPAPSAPPSIDGGR